MNGPDPFKRWARDEDGRSVLVGLSHVETREYFALETRDWANRPSDDPARTAEVLSKRRKRFLMLSDRHEAARARRLGRRPAG